jgi:urease accessory protein
VSVASPPLDRSRVDAELQLRASARGGDTALVMRGAGFPVAMRRTGPHRVHLVGTGAWPLGGDRVALSVQVDPGARLELVSVAATLALPGRSTARSHVEVAVDVGAGATAIVDLGPTVVAAGAEHASAMRVRLGEGARLLLRELVVLGRSGEPPGSSHSRIEVTCGSRPVLREVLVRPAGRASPAVDDDRRAVSGIVAVGFSPAADGRADDLGGWLALPRRCGWRSVDLDDDVAALQRRDDPRWSAAVARLDESGP